MKVFQSVSVILLILLVSKSQSSYLSIFDEYEKALSKIASGRGVTSDLFNSQRLSSIDQLYGRPFVPYAPASQEVPHRDARSYDYGGDYDSGSLEGSGGEDIFMSHPKELLPVFDTPNVERSYTVDVDADTVELSKRSIIVKPIIQYVIHQIKKNQESLRNPGKSHVSWHPQAESGKGWWTATEPSASFPNGLHPGGQGMQKELPQYEPDDSNRGVSLNGEAYFDSQGPPPGIDSSNGQSQSASPGGSYPPMPVNDGYSTLGESSHLASQDFQGAYGPPPNSRRPPPSQNILSFSNRPPPNQGHHGPPPSQGQYGPPPNQGHHGPPPNQGQYGHPPSQGQYGPPPNQGQHEHPGGVENRPMNPSQPCSSSWGWGCVPMNNGGMIPMGNLNQAMSQAQSTSNLNNFNNQLDRTILTTNYGTNPSIAEAISSLLKSVAGSSRPQGRKPESQYGPPGFQPGPPLHASPPTEPPTTTTPTPTTTLTTPTAPTTTSQSPPVLVASTTPAIDTSDASGSAMPEQEEPRPRPYKGPKRVVGGRRNKGLNAYFKVLVAGGLGPDHEEDQQQHSTQQRHKKGRGFSFGFNYPPQRRGLFNRMRHPHRRGKVHQQQQQHSLAQQLNAESRIGILG